MEQTNITFMLINNYSVIVFDLGNVLIKFDYNIAIKKLDSIEHNLGKKFYDNYRANYHIHRQFEKGLLTEEEFLEIMLANLDHKVEAEDFCRIYSEIFEPNQEVVSLLPKLKNNYQLILLSNTDPLHKKYGWDKYEFLSHFNYKVLSYEAKSVKPEEKIYRTVEQISQNPSHKHLYIDDIPEYVEAAKQLGWDAIQFLDYNQLYEELRSRGIL